METGCKVLIPDPSSNGNTRELEIMGLSTEYCDASVNKFHSRFYYLLMQCSLIGPSDDLVARCEELVKQCTKVVDPIELSDGMYVRFLESFRSKSSLEIVGLWQLFRRYCEFLIIRLMVDVIASSIFLTRSVGGIDYRPWRLHYSHANARVGCND
jgi:hypothetical protein